MLQLLTVFVCQFLLIMLMGIQSLNVQGRKYFAAGATSFLLGIGQFTVTAAIATAKDGGLLSPLGIAFLLGGPLGIMTSIWIHPKLKIRRK